MVTIGEDVLRDQYSRLPSLTTQLFEHNQARPREIYYGDFEQRPRYYNKLSENLRHILKYLILLTSC
jgi:hypothetical protein